MLHTWLCLAQKNRLTGYLYLGSNSTKTSSQSLELNAHVHVLCKLLKRVVSSAVEAGTGSLFANCQATIPLHHILAALNHSQPTTTVKIDISTATAFVNKNFKAKRSKYWDMRYF